MPVFCSTCRILGKIVMQCNNFSFQSSELQLDRAGAESRLQRCGDSQAVSM
jgi:hypothetical protein